ncbi:MAG: type II secretion system secretin GspD, partial [Candidatus Binatia bacterium]
MASVAFVLLTVVSRAQEPAPPANESLESLDRDLESTESAAPEPEETTPGLVAMNFQDVEIAVLARFISEITNKNFIVDEKVRGKVTILSPTKVTLDEAYAVFQSALQVKGFTTVQSGEIIKIVPSREARQSGLPTLPSGGLAAAGDQFITRLVPLAHVAAIDMAPVLQPMVSQDGLLIPYPPTNALILTDSASNVRRLLDILKSLDMEGHERVTEVIALQHASAIDVAKKIEEIMQAGGGEATPSVPRLRTVPPPGGLLPPAAGPVSVGGGAGQPVRVLPDERTNSLIVLSGPLELKIIRNLVAGLDVPLPPGTSKINVYPLKYANAEEMFPVLAELIGAGTGSGGISRPSRTSRRERRNRRGDRFRSSDRFGESSDRFGSAFGEQGAPLSSQLAQSPTVAGASGRATEFGSEVQITADPSTNSLIISAAPQDYETLKKVIAQLDVRRRQVYVEAMILEVSVDRIRELGIELQGGFSIAGEGIGLGRVNLRNLNTALTNPASLSGLLLAAASDRVITLPDGTRVPAQVALLRAVQNSSDINVLSAPTLLTSDNQEAEILVGQNVPFVSSRATDSTDLDNLFATVEREDVGITLRLTPQISEGSTVRLDIYEEVSAIVPTTVGDPNLVGPTTSV